MHGGNQAETRPKHQHFSHLYLFSAICCVTARFAPLRTGQCCIAYPTGIPVIRAKYELWNCIHGSD
jgi:hypothetical protein